MNPKPLQSFLDDPKLKRKHRKRLAQIEKERKQFVKELEDAQRLTAADFAIRFNCRDTLLCALLAALLCACASPSRSPQREPAGRLATVRAIPDDDKPERLTLYHNGSVIHPIIP